MSAEALRRVWLRFTRPAPLDDPGTAYARRLMVLTNICIVGWAFFGLYYLLAGYWWSVAVNGTVVALTAAIAVYARPLRDLASLQRAAHAVAGVSTLGLVALSPLSGGPLSMTVWYLVAVPLFAGYLNGLVGALIWAAVSLLAAGVVYAVEVLWHPLPEFRAQGYEQLMGLWVLICMVMAFAVAAARVSAAHVAALEAREVKIREQSAELAAARDTAMAGSRLKGEFLANMSHEIRTPMNAVVGMTGLLLDTPLSDDQREYASTVRTSAEALLTIINDILDFSKIESGRLEIDSAPFQLRVCAEEAMDLVAGPAADKGLELSCAIEESVPDVIIGDITRVRQTMLNLLSNAVKFTASGEVVLGAAARPVEGGLEVEVWVRDTGIGIPEELRHRLFQSFSQVDASTTRRFGGTGLGLAISRQLAELMGGAIAVESEVGRGSRFSFTFLTQAVLGQLGTSSSRRHAELAGRTLLVVDDDAASRRLLQRQAESWGMQPRLCASGNEALEWVVEGGRFDVAILDMQMPEMNGVELARGLRSLRGGVAPLVLLSSAGFAAGRAGEGGELFAAVLAKPASATRLCAVLKSILGVAVGEEGAPPPPVEVRLGERCPLRLLLVEDNAVNQKVALAMLARLGYRADVAGNGLEALAALERQPYDAVFMDVQMPEMDGLEATREIRRRWSPGDRPRIIAMTANAMQGDREEALAAGVDDYVTKPIRREELLSVLERTAGAGEILRIAV